MSSPTAIRSRQRGSMLTGYQPTRRDSDHGCTPQDRSQPWLPFGDRRVRYAITGRHSRGRDTHRDDPGIYSVVMTLGSRVKPLGDSRAVGKSEELRCLVRNATVQETVVQASSISQHSKRSREANNVAGRVVVITGASSGLGDATARHLSTRRDVDA